MTRYEYKRNGWLLGLFYCFTGVNVMIAGTTLGKGNVAAMGAVFFLMAWTIVYDHRENRRSKGEIWGAAVCHSFFTGIVLLVCFRWYILALYLLELALCIYIWRSKW